MIKEFRFKKDDLIKEYGIKYYFEKTLNSEEHIKSLGMAINKEYIFTIFQSSTIHQYYTDKNKQKLGITDSFDEDGIMFSCDSNNQVFTINFYQLNYHKNTEPFIGDYILKILYEYRKFVEENKERLDFTKVRLNLGSGFYRNNVVEIDFNKTYEGFYSMINAAIISINNEIYEAVIEKREKEQRQLEEQKPYNKIKRIIKSFINA